MYKKGIDSRVRVWFQNLEELHSGMERESEEETDLQQDALQRANAYREMVHILTFSFSIMLVVT